MKRGVGGFIARIALVVDGIWDAVRSIGCVPSGRARMFPDGDVRVLGRGTGSLSAQAVREIVASEGLNVEDADSEPLIRFHAPPRITAFNVNGRPMLGMSNLGDASSSAIEASTGLTYIRGWSGDSGSGDRVHCFTGDRDAVNRAWGYLWWQSARSREADRVGER